MAVSANYLFPASGATAPTSANFAGVLMCYTLTATADADTTITVPHLMGAAPLLVTLTPILSQALTALSGWTVAIGAANLVFTKLASTGSGNAAAQLQVVVQKPHSGIF